MGIGNCKAVLTLGTLVGTYWCQIEPNKLIYSDTLVDSLNKLKIR